MSEHFIFISVCVFLDYSRLCPTTPRPTLPVTALSSKDKTRAEDQMNVKEVASILLQLFGSVTVEPEWNKAEKQQAFRTLQKVRLICTRGL
jgi:hypothetical protein